MIEIPLQAIRETHNVKDHPRLRQAGRARGVGDALVLQEIDPLVEGVFDQGVEAVHVDQVVLGEDLDQGPALEGVRGSSPQGKDQ